MPKLSAERKALLDREIKEKVYVEALRMLKANQAQLFTMESLADKVGISKGTLYNYFEDKSDVVLYLNERLVKSVFADLNRELEHTTNYEQGLRLAFRTFSRTQSEHYFLNVAMLVIKMSEGERSKLEEAPGRLLVPYMTEFFERGIAAGVFKNMPVEYLSGFMAATMHGLSVFAGRFGHRSKNSRAAYSAAMEDLLVAALCR